MRQRPGLILALDVDNYRQAKRWVKLLYPEVKIFKVGLQLYTACGPGIIEAVRKIGAGVFLDLKFFDIPNTVASAVREAVRLKVKMLTLHISGGEEMLKAAVKAAKEEGKHLKVKRPLLIGVTVLTSKDALAGKVLRLAREGIGAGLDGVVSSAKEAALLRRKIKGKFIIVTPAVRLNRETKDDQKRVVTVKEAIEAGSDFIVMGRPILQAKNPVETVRGLSQA